MNVSVKNISGLFPKSLLVILLAVMPFAGSAKVNDGIEKSTKWTSFKTFGGVQVDYKYGECTSGSMRNQEVVFFKFTNTTQSSLTFHWTVEYYMDGECANCHRIDNPEYTHELTLAPGQTIEGDCNSVANQSLYLFSKFVNKVPGMSDTELTDFKFINLRATVSK
jgi:hypothetical protein